MAGYEDITRSGGGTWVLEPGYEGIRAGVRGYQSRCTRPY